MNRHPQALYRASTPPTTTAVSPSSSGAAAAAAAAAAASSSSSTSTSSSSPPSVPCPSTFPPRMQGVEEYSRASWEATVNAQTTSHGLKEVHSDALKQRTYGLDYERFAEERKHLRTKVRPQKRKAVSAVPFPEMQTFSPEEKDRWLQRLAGSTPLRDLAQTVPHGFQQETVMSELWRAGVPVARATWLMKIIFLKKPDLKRQRNAAGFGNPSTELLRTKLEATLDELYPLPKRTGFGQGLAQSKLHHSKSKSMPAAAPVSAGNPRGRRHGPPSHPQSLLSFWEYLERLAVWQLDEGLIRLADLLKWLVQSDAGTAAVLYVLASETASLHQVGAAFPAGSPTAAAAAAVSSPSASLRLSSGSSSPVTVGDAALLPPGQGLMWLLRPAPVSALRAALLLSFCVQVLPQICTSRLYALELAHACEAFLFAWSDLRDLLSVPPAQRPAPLTTALRPGNEMSLGALMSSLLRTATRVKQFIAASVPNTLISDLARTSTLANKHLAIADALNCGVASVPTAVQPVPACAPPTLHQIKQPRHMVGMGVPITVSNIMAYAPSSSAVDAILAPRSSDELFTFSSIREPLVPQLSALLDDHYTELVSVTRGAAAQDKSLAIGTSPALERALVFLAHREPTRSDTPTSATPSTPTDPIAKAGLDVVGILALLQWTLPRELLGGTRSIPSTAARPLTATVATVALDVAIARQAARNYSVLPRYALQALVFEFLRGVAPLVPQGATRAQLHATLSPLLDVLSHLAESRQFSASLLLREMVKCGYIQNRSAQAQPFFYYILENVSRAHTSGDQRREIAAALYDMGPAQSAPIAEPSSAALDPSRRASPGSSTSRRMKQLAFFQAVLFVRRLCPTSSFLANEAKRVASSPPLWTPHDRQLLPNLAALFSSPAPVPPEQLHPALLLEALPQELAQRVVVWLSNKLLAFAQKMITVSEANQPSLQLISGSRTRLSVSGAIALESAIRIVVHFMEQQRLHRHLCGVVLRLIELLGQQPLLHELLFSAVNRNFGAFRVLGLVPRLGHVCTSIMRGLGSSKAATIWREESRVSDGPLARFLENAVISSMWPNQSRPPKPAALVSSGSDFEQNLLAYVQAVSVNPAVPLHRGVLDDLFAMAGGAQSVSRVFETVIRVLARASTQTTVSSAMLEALVLVLRILRSQSNAQGSSRQNCMVICATVLRPFFNRANKHQIDAIEEVRGIISTPEQLDRLVQHVHSLVATSVAVGLFRLDALCRRLVLHKPTPASAALVAFLFDLQLDQRAELSAVSRANLHAAIECSDVRLFADLLKVFEPMAASTPSARTAVQAVLTHPAVRQMCTMDPASFVQSLESLQLEPPTRVMEMFRLVLGLQPVAAQDQLTAILARSAVDLRVQCLHLSLTLRQDKTLFEPTVEQLVQLIVNSQQQECPLSLFTVLERLDESLASAVLRHVHSHLVSEQRGFETRLVQALEQVGLDSSASAAALAASVADSSAGGSPLASMAERFVAAFGSSGVPAPLLQGCGARTTIPLAVAALSRCHKVDLQLLRSFAGDVAVHIEAVLKIMQRFTFVPLMPAACSWLQHMVVVRMACLSSLVGSCFHDRDLLSKLLKPVVLALLNPVLHTRSVPSGGGEDAFSVALALFQSMIAQIRPVFFWKSSSPHMLPRPSASKGASSSKNSRGSSKQKQNGDKTLAIGQMQLFGVNDAERTFVHITKHFDKVRAAACLKLNPARVAMVGASIPTAYLPASDGTLPRSLMPRAAGVEVPRPYERLEGWHTKFADVVLMG